MALFEDRRQAGRRLAERLAEVLPPGSDPIVLGLPRGGGPVAYEVARALGAPLDVLLVRKLGVPGHEELAMGAIASGGVRTLNPQVVNALGIPGAAIDAVAARERQELERRARTFRGTRPAPQVAGRTAILVDDGLATGASMRAAAAGLRQLGPARVVVAVPIAPLDTCRALEDVADLVVCAETPEPFYGVGAWYEDFTQTTDEEVRNLLRDAWEGPPVAAEEGALHG